MTTGNGTAPVSNDREIVVTRTVDAPRALVFSAWTDPRHLANWFAPRGTTIPSCNLDVKPGGRFHMIWQGADGSQTPVQGSYSEVAAPERLVYVEEWEAPGLPPQESVVTVTFEDQGGKTLLTVRTLFSTAEVREGAAQQGFATGWGEFFDRLAELLSNVR
jgi:uncharacterized protein YndB with AHSA1/START domain